MPYVIIEGCQKDGECIDACATESIVQGTFTDADGKAYDQMFVNPDTCIDCGSCEAVCPSSSIFADADLPEDKADFERINRAFFSQ